MGTQILHIQDLESAYFFKKPVINLVLFLLTADKLVL